MEDRSRLEVGRSPVGFTTAPRFVVGKCTDTTEEGELTWRGTCSGTLTRPSTVSNEGWPTGGGRNSISAIRQGQRIPETLDRYLTPFYEHKPDVIGGDGPQVVDPQDPEVPYACPVTPAVRPD